MAMSQNIWKSSTIHHNFISTADEYRVKLHENRKPGASDYINAVYVNVSIIGQIGHCMGGNLNNRICTWLASPFVQVRRS